MKYLGAALAILLSTSTRADERAAVYPNGVDLSLQDTFERLCSEAAAGDTVTIQILPCEYREQVYTICDKPLNIRLLGSGMGVTRFVSDDVDIEHNLDFGNTSFIVPSTTPAENTVEPEGSPQGYRELTERSLSDQRPRRRSWVEVQGIGDRRR